MDRSRKLLSDIAFYRTYSAVLPSGTKETWTQVCDRYEQMLVNVYPQLSELIAESVSYVREKKIVPSLRALQFAGDAIKRENARGYNCSFVAVTSPKDFCDALYLSACGVGVGYSVQRRHVDKLPAISKGWFQTYQIPDSREGWADSVAILFANPDVIFDYSVIRPAGARLTTGGFASGPAPLVEMHERMRVELLNAVGRKLRPVEVHRFMTSIADAIVAGGVRRSAMIALFDKDDEEMLTCKSGQWWEKYPQYARANNSAVLVRGKVSKAEFDAVLDACIKSNAGEPAVYWTNDPDHGTNPCVPAGTEILTSKGHLPIETLIDQPTEVWNGFEWSTVTPKITGHNQPLVKITFSDGRNLTCTRYHKFHISTGYKGQTSVVTAETLVAGNKLIKHELPVIQSGTPYANAYCMGFVAGDGMSNENWLYVYGQEKTKCIGRMNGVSGTPDHDRKRVRVKLPVSMPNKALVPIDGDLETRLNYFAGLLDSDGTELIEGGTQISSVDRNFLADVQKMLSLCGVQSKVIAERKKGIRSMPNGRGGSSEYECQEIYRICVGSVQMQFLKILGLRCERLTLNKKPQRDASQFVKVVSVEDAGIAETVYCFDEPLRHLGIFNGVITGQCAEISLRSRQFCNLTEVNAAACKTPFEFYFAVRHASVLGTLQAGMTSFNYIHPDWAKNCRSEALLGVSITGQAQNWDLVGNPDVLHVAAYEAASANATIASMIGINKAARITTTKPSGTTSVLLGTTSGIHASHAPHYIRRIRIAKHDPLGTYLAQVLPSEYIETDLFKPTDWVIAIPTQMTGIDRAQETSIDLMNRAKLVHSNWIRPGHRYGPNTHNVSLTVSYRPEEVDQVKQWMWENRESYSGISLLPFDGSSYKQAPYETCSEEVYESMLSGLPEIDLADVIYKTEDDTRESVAACEGGLCSIEPKP